MKTKKVVGKIFDAINYSKKLKISSILPVQIMSLLPPAPPGKSLMNRYSGIVVSFNS